MDVGSRRRDQPRCGSSELIGASHPAQGDTVGDLGHLGLAGWCPWRPARESMISSTRSVHVHPALMALTRIPLGPSSLARERTRPMTDSRSAFDSVRPTAGVSTGKRLVGEDRTASLLDHVRNHGVTQPDSTHHRQLEASLPRLGHAYQGNPPSGGRRRSKTRRLSAPSAPWRFPPAG